MVALAERVSGKELTEYANAWLYGADKPAEFTVYNGQSSTVDGGSVTDTPGEGSNSPAGWIALIVGVVAVAGAGVGFAVFKKKKSK